MINKNIFSKFFQISLVSLVTLANSCFAVAENVGPKIAECQVPRITTTSGNLCGKKANSKVEAYLGIKYGIMNQDLRFTIAQAFKSSENLVAQNYGAHCMQDQKWVSLDQQSEDCLYLNVWKPAVTAQEESSKKNKLPVMVFIHGGSFILGSGNSKLYDAANFVQRHPEVIVVTLNYRLGLLGFLSGPSLQGNYGIYDQQLALHWVQENIENFGGDPENVTLFGESAGAMSIGIHLQAEKSKNLFQAAIIESNPYGIVYKDQEDAEKIYQVVNNIVRLRCLLKKNCSIYTLPAWEMVDIQNDFNVRLRNLKLGLAGILEWAPHIDGDLIKEQPVLEKITKPVIIGVNRDEGIIFAEALKKYMNKVTYKWLITWLFGKKEAQEIFKHKRYDPKSGLATEELFSNIINDYLFICSSRQVLKNTKADSYGYFFDHIPSYNIWPFFPECAGKVCHTAELPYVFGNPVTTISTAQHLFRERFSFTEDEQKLVAWLEDSWVEFAKHHDPNALNAHGMAYPHWPKFAQGQQFQTFKLPIESRLTQNEKFACEFWDRVGYAR